MVCHVALEKIHGKDTYLIRFYNDMKDLCDPTKRSVDMYECSEVVCSKEALEEFNEVGDNEDLHEFSMADYDRMVKNINIQTERLSK